MTEKYKTRILRAGVIIFFIAVVLLLYSMRRVLLPFLLGIFLAYLLQPLGRFFQAKKIPLVFIVIIFYLLIAGIFSLLVFIVVPAFLEQAVTLSNSLPEFIADVGERLKALTGDFDPELLPKSIPEKLTQMQFDWEERLGAVLESLISFLFSGIRYLFALILAPILSYYMIRDQRDIQKSVVSMLPPAERGEIMRIAGDVNYIFRSFFTGYVLLAAIVGTLTFIALSLLGVRYAFLLGVVMAFCDLIPYFGPFIAAIPAVLIALLQSPMLAVYTIIAIFAVQQIESAILSPRILGKRIGMHPLATIFVVLIGGYYFGIFGLLLSVPTAASLKLIVSFAYNRFVDSKPIPK